MWAEIWHDIGPRIQSVLDTGVATWDEDLLLFLERSGYPEETYHTFSYSPLDDDDGRTAGMLCVVTENTERVLGERRMATLRDLAAAVGRRPAPSATSSTPSPSELGRNLADLPFSLIYLFDDDGTARLGARPAIAPGGRGRAGDDRRGRPGPGLAAGPHPRRASRCVVDDLDRPLPRPARPGAWQRPPEQAVAVPLASSAQEHGPVTGFLVVGLNPHRAFDDAYRGFVELLAGQIASGLVNAGSYEAERRRAEALAELDRGEDRLLLQRQPRVPDAADADHGPARGAAALPRARRPTPRAREELEVIERNALRLGKLVNTLLDFSRLQAGRIEARFEPVDLAATTAELASVFRSAVERAGLRFDRRLPAAGRSRSSSTATCGRRSSSTCSPTR